MREDQLQDYIVENKVAKRIPADSVKDIAERVRKLAQFDPDFTDKATEAFKPAEKQRAEETVAEVRG